MTQGNHEKTSVRLVGTGIRTRDLPNASLVRYHGATSLCGIEFYACLLYVYLQGSDSPNSDRCGRGSRVEKGWEPLLYVLDEPQYFPILESEHRTWPLQ